MPNEIYHRSNWGESKAEDFGDVYYDHAATNKLYNHSDYYENSDGTDATLKDLNNKASIALTPTAYSDGSLNTVIPPYQVLSELVTNGDFSDGTNNWQGNVNTTLSVSNGQLDIQSGGGSGIYGVAFTEVNFVAGKKYLIKLDVISTDRPTQIRVGTSGTVITGTPTNIFASGDIGIGSHEKIFTATGNFTYLAIGGRNDMTTLVIDNVSVREVTVADFDFSRGSSATRVNEQGLVEDVQILSGELVQNGDFSQQGSELVVNGTFLTDTTTGWNDWSNITNPNNSSQQDGYGVLDATTGAADARQEPTVTPNKIYKIEATLKEDAGANGRLYMSDGANYNYAFGNFDATTTETTFVKYVVPTQTVIRLYAYTTGSAKAYFKNISVKEVGQNWLFQNGWNMGDGVAVYSGTVSAYRTIYQENALTVSSKYRLTFDIVSISSGSIENISQSSPTSYSTVGTKTEDFIATSTDLFLKPTTDANLTIDNVSIKEVTDDTDLPRIDFTGGTGSLLLEPQRTNKITYSENFSIWSTNEVTLESGYTAPDGSTNAYKVTRTGTSAYVVLSGGLLGTDARTIYARTVSGSGDVKLTSHNLNTNNLFTVTEEWQRFEVNSATQVGTNFYAVDFRGAGTTLTEVILWGAQCEVGDYATSYIVSNSGSATTRSADVANNSGNADLFNDSEGVLYAEIAALADDGTNRSISISDSTDANRIELRLATTDDRIQYNVRTSSVTQASIFTDAYDVLDFNKIALLYKDNDFRLFVNGTQVATDTGGTAPTGLKELAFDLGDGSNDFYGNVKALAVFKEALSNDLLERLTGEGYESFRLLAEANNYTII